MNQKVGPMPLDVETLFRDHHDPLFRYLVRLTGDTELAADATQEAFVRMIEKQPDDCQPRAWLYAVATNFARDTARTRARHRDLDAREANRLAADPPPDPREIARARREVDRLRVALDALSDRDRTILLMREEGFAHREIAAAIGTTTGSIGTMLARALEKLSARLYLRPDSSG